MNPGFLLGVVSIVCGTVMLVYGAALFRFVLAFAGFYAGFVITINGFALMGPGAPGSTAQFLMAAIVGATAGALLFMLVRVAVYAAGAMLGLVVGLLFASMFPLGGAWMSYQIGLGLALIGAVFGRKIGPALTIFASASAGAYVMVTGLAMLFGLQARYGLMPVDARTLTVFVVFGSVSCLAQFRVRSLRHMRTH